jgi:hypothetical protein
MEEKKRMKRKRKKKKKKKKNEYNPIDSVIQEWNINDRIRHGIRDVLRRFWATVKLFMIRAWDDGTDKSCIKCEKRSITCCSSIEVLKTFADLIENILRQNKEEHILISYPLSLEDIEISKGKISNEKLIELAKEHNVEFEFEFNQLGDRQKLINDLVDKRVLRSDPILFPEVEEFLTVVRESIEDLVGKIESS